MRFFTFTHVREDGDHTEHKKAKKNHYRSLRKHLTITYRYSQQIDLTKTDDNTVDL